MKQGDFIRRRESEWRWMEETLNIGLGWFKSRAWLFPSAYRRVVRDLNIARSESHDPALVERLDRIVMEGHGRLYENRRWKPVRLLFFLTSGFPRAVRQEWRLIIIFTLAFVLAALLSGILIRRSPWMFSSWFSPDAASALAEMYNPESSHFMVPRDVTGDADMFGFYIYNNVSILFQTFASGILAGFGSILFLLYNACFLGAAAAYLTNLGFGPNFYPFISGHGTVELLAMIVAGAAGWRMGIVLIRPPNRLSRKQGLRQVGRRVLPLVFGSALLLILAAVIEAFWSSSLLPNAVKYGFGILMGAGLLAYLALGGRRADV